MCVGGVRDGEGGGGSMRDGVLMYIMRVLLSFLYCSAL